MSDGLVVERGSKSSTIVDDFAHERLVRKVENSVGPKESWPAAPADGATSLVREHSGGPQPRVYLRAARQWACFNGVELDLGGPNGTCRQRLHRVVQWDTPARAPALGSVPGPWRRLGRRWNLGEHIALGGYPTVRQATCLPGGLLHWQECWIDTMLVLRFPPKM